MLDLDATDLTSIASHVVDQLVLSGQLPTDCRGHVLKALLLKHRYATTSLCRAPPHEQPPRELRTSSSLLRCLRKNSKIIYSALVKSFV